MKKLAPDARPRSRKWGTVMAAAALLLIVILLSLPLFEATTTVYTKKSANTFVGDEKYLSVKADVEADRKSTRLNSSHPTTSRMPSSA